MSKRGGRVDFKPISAPETEWKSAMNALEVTLKMEKEVNQSLLNLHKIAEENDDPATEDFIENDFLGEQIDDIKRAADYITQLNRCGDGLGLYIFDKEIEESLH